MQNRRPGGGRKPKPDNLKIIQGTFTGKQQKQAGLSIEGGYPPMPDHLDACAVEEWNRVKTLMEPKNIFCALDMALLAVYCCLYSRIIEAEKNLNLEGLDEKKKIIWYKIWSKSVDQIKVYMLEMGLTPLSRGKFPAGDVDPKPGENGFSKFKKPVLDKD